MAEFTLLFEFGGENIIIENDGFSVWAYLLNSESGEIEKDVILFNVIEPENTLDEAHIEQGNPPKLTKSFASEHAFNPEVAESRLSVLSSENSDYAILYNKVPIAALYHNKQRGYSKALVKSGGFGIPWCESVYTKTFS